MLFDYITRKPTGDRQIIELYINRLNLPKQKLIILFSLPNFVCLFLGIDICIEISNDDIHDHMKTIKVSFACN